MNAYKILDFVADKILFLPVTLTEKFGLPKPLRFLVVLFTCSIWMFLTSPLWCPLALIGLIWTFYDEV